MGPTAPGYFLGLVIVAACVLVPAAQARTLFWTGGGVNNKWSNPDNWSLTFAPTPGDTLVFDSGAITKINNNDISNFDLFPVQFAGGFDGYKISGNPILLESDISSTQGKQLNRILFDIQLTTGGGTSTTWDWGHWKLRAI